jgi:hypothetical protein
MTTLQRVAGSLGVLAVVAIGIDELAKKARGAPPDVDRLAGSLKQLAVTGQFTGELKATFKDVDGFVAKFQQLRGESKSLEQLKPLTAFSGLGSFTDTAVTKLDDLTRGAKSLGATKDDFKSFDESFAQLAKGGDAKLAAQQFARLSAVLRANRVSTKEITALFPAYTSAVADAAAEQKLAAQSMGIFGVQAQQTSAKLAEQKLNADGLRQAIIALNEVNRAALDSQAAFEASIDNASAAAAKYGNVWKANGGVLDVTTDTGRAAYAALSDLGAKTNEASAAGLEAHNSWEEVQKTFAKGRTELIASAQQMGLNKTAAAALADQILKTPDRTAYLKGNVEDLKRKLADAKIRLEKAPSSKTAAIRGDISNLQYELNRAQLALGQLRDGWVCSHQRQQAPS